MLPLFSGSASFWISLISSSLRTSPNVVRTFLISPHVTNAWKFNEFTHVLLLLKALLALSLSWIEMHSVCFRLCFQNIFGYKLIFWIFSQEINCVALVFCKQIKVMNNVFIKHYRHLKYPKQDLHFQIWFSEIH